MGFYLFLIGFFIIGAPRFTYNREHARIPSRNYSFEVLP
jgi:hypothetical protein